MRVDVSPPARYTGRTEIGQLPRNRSRAGTGTLDRRWLVILIASACQTLGLPARAANERAQAQLRYEREQGTESCPSEPDLRAAVAARLGYDPFVANDGLDTIVVRTRRRGTRLEGTIERIEPSRRQGGRPTTIASLAGDCGELGASLAVALAIAVDPLSIAREAPPRDAIPDTSPPPCDSHETTHGPGECSSFPGCRP